MTTIQILGTGLSACDQLAKNAKEAAHRAGVVCKIEHVDDVDAMRKYDVKLTPALAVNGKVKVSGWVPSPEEITKLLR